jgi:2-hydroxychromene-2-carboxylate isomerase
MPPDMSDSIAVDFYFDVSCRWAWWASIWLQRVARQQPITVSWKIFSLAVQDNPENYREPPARPHHVRDVDLHRAMVAARQSGGNTAVERLYRAYGNALHAEKADLRELSIQARCLSEAGLPQTLFDDAQHDQGTEAELVAETRAALSFGVLGTPSLSLTGSETCLLGPVLGQVPSDAEALELWRSVQFALEHPYVYELKRNRDKGTPDGLRAD